MSKKVVRNVFAKQLAERKYSQRIVGAKKGKGSYKRKKVKYNEFS